jgi:hypothetical protein
VSKATRILVGDGGFASAMGPLLFVGVGLGFTWLGLADLNEAVRVQPVEQTCAAFLAAPGATARWVSLTGCRLDLPSAASRRWSGWLPGQRRDAGVGGMTLELFIPLSVRGEAPPERPTAVVATTEKALLGLIDQLQQLDSEQRVEAFMLEHQAELERTLGPEKLVGYVEPLASTAAHAALGVLTAEGAVVLEQGRQPQRVNSLCSVLFGMALLVWGLLPITRRWKLETES